MPTKKIENDQGVDQWAKGGRKPPCMDSDHDPPSMRLFAPGLYEHTCQSCGKVTMFRVPYSGLLEQLARWRQLERKQVMSKLRKPEVAEFAVIDQLEADSPTTLEMAKEFFDEESCPLESEQFFIGPHTFLSLQHAVRCADDLAMLVRRLAAQHPNEKLRAQALGYIDRKNLGCSILRTE